MAPKFMTPLDHYWAVAGNDTQVYSSKSNTYVPLDDPAYVEWLVGRVPGVPIASEADIWPSVSGAPRSLPAWLFDGITFAQPAEGEYTATQLAAYNADARWHKEQGGTTATAGFPIKTDDRAQAKITGVYAASKESPAVVTPWHAADGTVHQLDAAGMYALNTDLLTHINNCFAVSADVLAQIEAGGITTLEAIDAAYDAPMTQARKDWLKPKTKAK